MEQASRSSLASLQQKVGKDGEKKAKEKCNREKTIMNNITSNNKIKRIIEIFNTPLSEVDRASGLRVKLSNRFHEDPFLNKQRTHILFKCLWNLYL